MLRPTFVRPRTRAARLGLVVALLAVPALVLSALGGVGREEVTPLPVLGRVTDFALVDQSSAPVTRATLDGEPWVASFAFTRCSSVCPRLAERMRALQTLAQRRDGSLHLVTFSVDPEHDRPNVLRSYADAHGADASTWRFLTGSEATIESIARSFAVAFDGEADPARSGIMHSGHLVLVDGRGRIRGYYPSSDEGVEQKIVDDLRRLGAS